MSCYKIKNTTKKEDATKGKHKLGFTVSIPKGPWLRPGAEAVIENITDPILKLSKKGWLRIEKSEEDQETLKMKAVEEELKKEMPKETETVAKKTSEESEPISVEKKPKKRVKKKKADNDPLATLEQPVYPEGEPNFVVEAPSQTDM